MDTAPRAGSSSRAAFGKTGRKKKKKPNCAKHLRNKEGFDSTSVPEENKELGSTHSRHGVSFRKIAEMSCESPSQQNISDADQKINKHCQA